MDTDGKEALLEYAQAYNLKKNHSSEELALRHENLRYVIYARRSTEDDSRQQQSVENQIELCKNYALQNNLHVVDILKEEKSAKKAGRRVKFIAMLKKIKEEQTYNAILAWHPDRLSRNMKESGEILDMLDSGVLADLKFVSITFNNDASGKMMLSILFSLAKEFSDKLSDDTTRGVRKAVESGNYCGTAKRGYYYNEGKKFRPDDRFKIYSQLWQDALNGYSQIQILEKYPELKFKRSTLSPFLKDPFYAGIYCYGDVITDLTIVDAGFKPQISVNDFLTIQNLKKRREIYHSNGDFLPFRNLVKCADCGSYMIPGRSTSHSKQKYLYVSCGNNECRKKLKRVHKASNSIRGKVIVDFAIDYISEHLNINENLYNDAIKDLRATRYDEVDELRDKLKIKKGNETKLETKENKLEEALFIKQSEALVGKIDDNVGQINLLKDEIQELELKIAEKESDLNFELPKYNQFVNFFEKAVLVLRNSDNPVLIDNIVKLVFLNLYIGERKVYAYDLKEPFIAYDLLKFRHGVDNGT